LAAPEKPMTRIEHVLRDVAETLGTARKRFALIGGLAVSARAEPRFTRDVDWAVAVQGDAEAENLIHDLVKLGYSVLMTAEQDATNRLATVRLLPPNETAGGVVADLLFASSGIEPELVADAETIEIFPSLHIPVAQIGHLIALKVLSVSSERPQDLADLRALFNVAATDDLAMAKQAMRLIEARGFARGKRLLDDLARLTSEP
jgi:hypothetical protein